MPTAREKLEEVCRGIRQRQEQQAQAEALWKRALPRCEAIARSLVEVLRQHGVPVEVAVEEGQLVLAFPPRDCMAGQPARCRFAFNRQGRTVEGWRTPYHLEGARPEEQHCFSLSVRLPDQYRPVNEFGPSPVEQQLSVDTQDAFERAVVDFLEWALVKDGCGGMAVRLP